MKCLLNLVDPENGSRVYLRIVCETRQQGVTSNKTAIFNINSSDTAVISFDSLYKRQFLSAIEARGRTGGRNLQHAYT
jgi:hypothetical protein